MIIKGILMLFSLFAISSGIEFSVLSQGLTKASPFQSVAVKNKEELKRVWSKLGITGEIPNIVFKKELVVILASSWKREGTVQISSVERKKDDVEVRFVVRPSTTAAKMQGAQLCPYILAKLYPLDVEKTKVKFIEDVPKPPVPINSGIGQASNYTNDLNENRNITTSQFLPLDKGSIWTYRVESMGNTSEETYSVRSISQDGWSVFDGFFGKKQLAMRIDHLGEIYVSSEKGIGAFYTPEVQKSFKKGEFSTPAGKFNDLMVVTIPKNDKFWFKDVYARGVGLIYHEQQSPKGIAKYTLVRAHVRGKEYPSH
jgi:hypothetical protein